MKTQPSFFHKYASGFTVLELLIVLAVFGLLATLAIFSLNSSRMGLRDAQRLSDINVLQNVLGRYWLEKATYPVSAGVNLGQPGTNTEVFSSAGFVSRNEATPPLYLNQIPVGPKGNEYYRYRGGPNGYSIRFKTEGDTVYGKANVYYAHASGVDLKDEEK